MKINADIQVYEAGRRAPEYEIKSDFSGQKSLEELFAFTKRALINIADFVVREEQAAGFDKNPVVIVDGRQNKNIIDVSPVGKLEFVARAQASTIFKEIYAGILERSPVDTGFFRENNVVLWNRTLVAKDEVGLERWLKSAPNLKPGDTVTFVNITPYARKLERLGTSAGRSAKRFVASKDKSRRTGTYIEGRKGKQILGANGAYFLTARSVLRTYKQNAKIKFSYLPGSAFGAGISFPTVNSKTGKRLRTTYSSNGQHSKSGGRAYLYPAIRVVIREGGTI